MDLGTFVSCSTVLLSSLLPLKNMVNSFGFLGYHISKRNSNIVESYVYIIIYLIEK